MFRWRRFEKEDILELSKKSKTMEARFDDLLRRVAMAICPAEDEAALVR